MKEISNSSTDTKQRKLTSHQKVFLFIMILCIIGCMYTVIKVQYARQKIRNSVAVTAQITKASPGNIAAQKQTSSTKHGTSSTCYVKVYQDLTFDYFINGQAKNCTMKKVVVFSKSYNCRNTGTAMAYARGALREKKYLYEEGDSLAIYVEKKNADQVYLADELETQTGYGFLFLLASLGIYFLILSFVRFTNASGISDAGVMFGLVGVVFLSFMIMDVFYNGVRVTTTGIVASVVSFTAILIGILLIRWDLKEDNTRKK